MVITLEAARINAGYSQKEAAELFGVHYQTIAKWEDDNTKMPFDMVNKILTTYGIEHNNIFFGNKNEFIRSIREEAKKYKGVLQKWKTYYFKYGWMGAQLLLVTSGMRGTNHLEC